MTNINESNPVFTEVKPEDAASINGGVNLVFRTRGQQGKKIRVGFWKGSTFINLYKGRDTDLIGDGPGGKRTVDKYINYFEGRMRRNGVTTEDIKAKLCENNYFSRV